ncbi:MAG: DUF4124 domain-containing protein [Lysobacteraceae bacterium]
MASLSHHRVLPGLLLIVGLISANAAHADDVTIYRCVDPAGKVSLQDSRCPTNTRQQVREMQRPQDPPPRPPQIAATPTPAPPPTEIRIVHVHDPQPLYECRNPDTGETYLSQTGVPEGRYVPFWTLGYGDPFANVGASTPARSSVPRTGRLPHGSFAYPAMMYVQDTCVRLPQAEICRRMHARDDALGTLIFNAQPVERANYEREREGLAEQMRGECRDN